MKGEVACILIIDFWIILNNACTRWPCNCHRGIVTFQLPDVWDIVQCQMLFSDITIDRDFCTCLTFFGNAAIKGYAGSCIPMVTNIFVLLWVLDSTRVQAFPKIFTPSKVNYLYFS